VKLHCVEAGAGPIVVLLHGFPEHWYAWRHQIPALAAAGFRVLAPDMRGYNLSDKPRGVRHYRLDVLARDVVELIRHAGATRAHVIGHDWGGLVAWRVAMSHPTVVERLVVLNAPHPGVVCRGLFRNGQLKRSRYILFFQVPRLAERRFARGDFAILRRSLRRDPVRPGAFSEEEIQRYVEAMRRPGALTAALNYYRAIFRAAPLLLFKSHPRIDVPVLLIWGERDRYLGRHLIDGTERWVGDLRVERIAEASHWVQADAPERVNALLLEHLRGGELVPERVRTVGQSEPLTRTP
jgi:pimeloyl-ACP methyl ester carboxylesterase